MSNSSDEEKDNVRIAWHESIKVMMWSDLEYLLGTWDVNSSEIVVLSSLLNINVFYIVLFSMIEIYFIL